MQQDDFVDALHGLSKLEGQLLALAAVLTPCSRSALSERAYRLRLGRSESPPISDPEVGAYVKRWLERAWFTQTSEGLCLDEPRRYRILRWATARDSERDATAPESGETQLLIQAAEGFSNLGFRGLTDLHGAFRAAWLRRDAQLMARILQRYYEVGPAAYAFENPLLYAVCTDFDAHWFASLPSAVQTLAQTSALELCAAACFDLGEFWSYLVNKARQSELPSEQAEYVIAGAVLRGEWETARELLGLAKSPGLAALFQALSGDGPYVPPLAASQSKARAKATGDGLLAGVLGYLPALFHIAQFERGPSVVAAQSNSGETDVGQSEPKAPQSETQTTAKRGLTALSKRVGLNKLPAPDRAAAPLLRSLFQALDAPQGVETAAHVGARIHYVDVVTPLLRALYAAWFLKHSYELGKCQEDCGELAKQCTKRGYHWLAGQFEATARFLGQKRGQPAGLDSSDVSRLTSSASVQLVELHSARSAWERTLQALARFGGTATPGRSIVNDGTERLAWVIHPAQRVVEVLVQRSNAGAWSAGRSVGLRQLFTQPELQALVRPADERVLKRFDADRDVARAGAKPALIWEEALPALVEHPCVYLGGEPPRRIELVAGRCRIRVVERANSYLVSSDPAGIDFSKAGQTVYLCREGARWVVYAPRLEQREALAIVGKGLDVPKQGKQQLEQTLTRLGQVLEVSVGWAPTEPAAAADARVGLRIVPLEESYNLTCLVRPLGAGTEVACDPGEGEPRLSGVRSGVQYTVLRDLDRERRYLDALLSACPTLIGTEQGCFTFELSGPEALLAVLSSITQFGEDVFLEWPRGEPITMLRSGSQAHFRGSVALERGWFLIDGHLRLENGADVALSTLLSQLKYARGRFVPLTPQTYVELDELLLKQLRALLACRARGEDVAGLRVSANALSVLMLLSEKQSLFHMDASSRACSESVNEVFAAAYPQPSGFVGELRKYQLEAYAWLRRLSELRLGACLADDMGLGKTPVAIALFLARASLGAGLVIAPTSVCSNWLREGQRFAPQLNWIDYAASRAKLAPENGESTPKDEFAQGNGPQNEAATDVPEYAEQTTRVVVVSYALFQRDLEHFRKQHWSTLLLDEAQFIKNAGSQRSQAVCTLSADARVALTGTPIENQAADLFGLFRFLNPGLLGDVRAFEARFGELEAAPDAEQTRLNELRLLLSPFILRRLKADVLDELPPLTVVDEVVEFSDTEQLLYDRLREEIRSSLKSGRRGKGETDSESPASGRAERGTNRITILAQIMRLRQFCCEPRLLHPELSSVGSKLQRVVERVATLRETGHQVLIFSQFVGALALLRDELERAEIVYSYLDGSTERTARQRQIDAFQAGQSDVFLISLRAGGFGLNLTAADYVIHLDPWWNPAVEAQATDRAHRSGQERPVTAYRFAMKGSVEARILDLHGRKREFAERVLSGADAASELQAQELIELLNAALGT